MEKILAKIGLSDNAAKIYLAALSMGPSSANALAESTKIKRPTTYLTLENLVKQGLISETIQNKKKLFKAEQPEKLNKLTRKMRRQVISAELELEKLMPELKAIRKKIIEAPKASVYRGLEGVKNIIEEFTGSKTPWYLFGSSETIMSYLKPEELGDIITDTNKLRENAGKPKAHLITDKGILKIKQFQTSNFKIREIKILPNIIKATSAFVIYEDKVAVFSINESPFGIIVESEEISEMLKVMYNIFWTSFPTKPI